MLIQMYVCEKEILAEKSKLKKEPVNDIKISLYYLNLKCIIFLGSTQNFTLILSVYLLNTSMQINNY